MQVRRKAYQFGTEQNVKPVRSDFRAFEQKNVVFDRAGPDSGVESLIVPLREINLVRQKNLFLIIVPVALGVPHLFNKIPIIVDIF